MKLIDIDVNLIDSHPENPRKDLGDITELTESIKKNGILQNLTVVPIGDKFKRYRALIGHRRLAAAKAAGIEKVPCKVVEGLSEKEQITTMLEENMQRNDLTVIEQAKSFQMVIDMGETVGTLAEKTGFSTTTVRSRLELAKLDDKILKEAVEEKQITFQMLNELSKVEDIKQREKILKDATSGSSVKWSVENYIRQQEKKQKEKEIKDFLAENGIEKAPDGVSTWTYGWEQLQNIRFTDEEITIKDDDREKFWIDGYECIYIMVQKEEKPQEETPEQKAERERKEEERKNIENLKGLCTAAWIQMRIFAQGFWRSGKKIEVKPETIWGVINKNNGNRYNQFADRDEIGEFMERSMLLSDKGRDGDDIDDSTCEENYEWYESMNMTSQMLIFLMAMAPVPSRIYDYNGYYDKADGELFLGIYEILKEMGFGFTDNNMLLAITGEHEHSKHTEEE